jgi:hypothetical protein
VALAHPRDPGQDRASPVAAGHRPQRL